MRISKEIIGRIKGMQKQGDRFMLVLACMIRHGERGVERFGQLRLENGHSIYASFRRSDIESTCASPDIHQIMLKKEARELYVNITLDRKAKSKLLRIAGRRLGFPAHEVNQLDELIGPSAIDQSLEALRELKSMGII